MKKYLPVFGLAIILFLGGCLTATLHPPYTNENIMYDPALVGVWIEAESGEVLRFAESDGKSYSLIYIDDNGKAGRFRAFLFKIGDKVFLDFSPVKPTGDWNDVYKEHLLPLHSFMLVEQIEPDLKLALLEMNKLEELLAAEPNIIANEKLDGSVILTAPTEELVKFISDHVIPNNLFGEAAVFTRAGK
jgi:hypothetical protein